MTNQEIEKRFQFDLEMGRFKTISTMKLRIPIDVIIFNWSYLSASLMGSILRKFGYKETEYRFLSLNDHPKETCRNVIIINKTEKVYCLSKLYFSKREYENYFNEIPDYIRQIELW